MEREVLKSRLWCWLQEYLAFFFLLDTGIFCKECLKSFRYADNKEKVLVNFLFCRFFFRPGKFSYGYLKGLLWIIVE